MHAYLYLGLYNEHHRDQLRKVTDAIHAAGGKAGVQIWHGGFVPEEFFDKTNKLETPDTLTVERIHEIVKQFGYSAKLAVEAGFDALEFHGAHTYLPHEFMNPSLNKRTDEYGNQSLENRAASISKSSARCARTCRKTCRCSCVWTPSTRCSRP